MISIDESTAVELVTGEFEGKAGVFSLPKNRLDVLRFVCALLGNGGTGGVEGRVVWLPNFPSKSARSS